MAWGCRSTSSTTPSSGCARNSPRRADLNSYRDADHLALDGLLDLARTAKAEGDQRWLARIEHWLLPQDPAILDQRRSNEEGEDEPTLDELMTRLREEVQTVRDAHERDQDG